MRASPMSHVRPKQLECEFIPPVDARETWGPAWDQQLSAALAWQEAGANSDGQWEQWAEPAPDIIVPPLEQSRTGFSGGRGGSLHVESSEVTLRTVARMNTLLMSLKERLLQITSETSNIVIMETARRQPAAAGAPGRADATASALQLQDDKAQRILELAESFFDIIAAAQTSMTALTHVAPREASSGGLRSAANDASGWVERRRSAITIDFPDRRMAG